MDILIAIVAFLFLVGLIITIHEGGHFLVGRMCGMKMLEFSIGFGNKIYETRFGKDKTKFTLRMLPLGGFVKPLDESAVTKEEWEALTKEEQARSFTNAAKWKKFLMVLAGPMSNFILAFIVYVLAMCFVGTSVTPATVGEIESTGNFVSTSLKEGDVITQVNDKKINHMAEAYTLLVNNMIKGENTTIKTNKDSYSLDFSNKDLKELASQDPGKLIGFYFTGTTGDVTVDKVNSDSIAEKSGLKKGDVVKFINGEAIVDLNKMIRRIRSNPDKKMVLSIERNKQKLKVVITPETKLENGISVGKIGASFEIKNENNTMKYRYGIGEGVTNSFNKVVDSSYTTLISIKKLVTGELSIKSISGPIAIADYSGKSAQRGLYYYLLMIAAISIAIGVFNLLPVPTLDGGHLAQYIVEGVIGRDIPQKVLNHIQYAGFGLLIGFSAFSLLNDIFKYIF